VRSDQVAAISHDRTQMAHTHRMAEDGDMPKGLKAYFMLVINANCPNCNTRHNVKQRAGDAA
jgi:hypothetical protein